MSSDVPHLSATEDFLHQHIPLSQIMGIKVERDEHQRVLITAPLEINHNHLGTAFGGSLSAIATLAGYAFLWLELNDSAVHLVVKESSIKYLRPIHRTIRAICHRPEPSALETFKTTFAAQGRARIRCKVTMTEDHETAVIFQGIYVAIK